MIVADELRIAVAADIPVYAAAQATRRVIRDALRAGLVACELLRGFAETIPVLVVDALLAPDEGRELLRLRQAELVIDLLREDAWLLHRAGDLPAHHFDAIALAAARCRREVVDMVVRARHRAWARLHGVAWANASSRRPRSDVNSSSSHKR